MIVTFFSLDNCSKWNNVWIFEICWPFSEPEWLPYLVLLQNQLSNTAVMIRYMTEDTEVNSLTFMSFLILILVHSPLFSRLRYSISACSFSKVFLCCCWRNWIFLCIEATRGSVSLWRGGSTAAPSPLLLSAGGAAGSGGSGGSWLGGNRRGEQGFSRRPTRLHWGRCLTGGRLLLLIAWFIQLNGLALFANKAVKTRFRTLSY